MQGAGRRREGKGVEGGEEGEVGEEGGWKSTPQSIKIEFLCVWSTCSTTNSGCEVCLAKGAQNVLSTCFLLDM